MKKSIYLNIVVALLVCFASVATAGNAPKKHLGIATYSVKGLESNIEGALS